MMKVLISSLLLGLSLMLVSVVSSNPNPGVARGHRDLHQASRRLPEGSLECECKDQLLRVPKRKFMTLTVPRPPRKQCPCDHFKASVKKTRHRRHHRKPNKLSRACQQFLQRCQLASLALPI